MCVLVHAGGTLLCTNGCTKLVLVINKRSAARAWRWITLHDFIEVKNFYVIESSLFWYVVDALKLPWPPQEVKWALQIRVDVEDIKNWQDISGSKVSFLDFPGSYCGTSRIPRISQKMYFLRQSSEYMFSASVSSFPYFPDTNCENSKMSVQSKEYNECSVVG